MGGDITCAHGGTVMRSFTLALHWLCTSAHVLCCQVHSGPPAAACEHPLSRELIVLCCFDRSDLTERHRRLAEIIEMIHTASLVHDDVLDECDTRRGQNCKERDSGCWPRWYASDVAATLLPAMVLMDAPSELGPS